MQRGIEMLWLLIWTLYGLIVGLIAKFLHPGEDPVGFFPTIGIGIAGSYIGGFLNFVLGRGDPFSPSGLIMGIIGGVIFCYGYRKFRINRFLEMKALRKKHQTPKD